MKATAKAYANLAFIKYWGKANPSLNLPLNNSISMNLSAAETTTTVEFHPTFETDWVYVDGQRASANFVLRVSQQLDRIRNLAQTDVRAHVTTRNSFPMGAGFASSASGMAALTEAGLAALGLNLSQLKRSALARRGSGSACRSIPAGFVEWYAGEEDETSYAVQLAPPNHWDIADVAVIVSREEKKVSSTLGHQLVKDSPFLQARLKQLPQRLQRLRQGLMDKNFDSFGQEMEAEAVTLHAMAMTSPHKNGQTWSSGIYYWTPETLELIIAVQQWRADGLPVYFTLDAGPTVHLICPQSQVATVKQAVETIAQRQPKRTWDMLVSYPADGAMVVKE